MCIHGDKSQQERDWVLSGEWWGCVGSTFAAPVQLFLKPVACRAGGLPDSTDHGSL